MCDDAMLDWVPASHFGSFPSTFCSPRDQCVRVSPVPNTDSVASTQSSRSSQLDEQNEPTDDADEENDGEKKTEEAVALSNVARCILNDLQQKTLEIKTKKKESDGSLFRHLEAATLSSSTTSLTQTQTQTKKRSPRNIRGRAAGGKLVYVSSNDEYHDLIVPLVAKDIEDNIISTLVEYTDIKLNGVRLFVKLAYGSFRALPSQEVVDAHLRIAHELAYECFPDMDASQHIAVVQKWQPHVRKNNNAKTTQLPLLRSSFALIWPNIVVRDPNEMLTFYATLNMRITARNPEFANPVDNAVIVLSRSEARLSTLFSFKVVNCIRCREPVKAMADYESSDEEQETRAREISTKKKNAKKEPCNVCGDTCREVKSIGVSYYCDVKWDMLTKKSHIITSQRDIEQALSLHSIIPTDANCETSHNHDFHEPHDAPLLTDPIAWNSNRGHHSPFGRDLLCASDNNKINKDFIGLKTTKRLDPTKHMELFQLCTTLVRWVGSTNKAKKPDGPYKDLVVHNININTVKKVLYVNVQGRGARYCFLNGGDHVDKDARVYFMIYPRFFSVNAHCNNDECQKKTTAYFEFVRKKNEQKRTDKKKRKKKGALQDNDEDTLLMPSGLNEHEKDLLMNQMHFEIPMENNMRDTLMFLALGVHYYCPTSTSITLGQRIPQEDSKEAKTEDLQMDPDLQVLVPSSLLDGTIDQKMDYVSRVAKKRKNPQHLNTRAQICFFVDYDGKNPMLEVSDKLFEACVMFLQDESPL